MSTIPISLTEKQFDEHIRPYVTVAKRGYECKISLYKVFNYILYQLHTGCQWYQLPIDPDPDDPDKKEISWHAVYYHFRKWSNDGSLERVWQGSIMTISAELNLSELNLDGSHVLAKKGGESVAYQGRKKGKTTNILPISDSQGFIIASTGLIARNHNDAYNLKTHLQDTFKFIKRLGLNIQGAFFNADKALTPKRLAKPASIMLLSLTLMRINEIARRSSVVASAFSTKMFTNIASPVSGLLPGLINSGLC